MLGTVLKDKEKIEQTIEELDRYKYILDEIDATLDLSHTQHIGTLFRTRFHGAQFIVVSPKEGLFTNGNVLFRTRFRDGRH
jgi:chromosome segregation ATPase